MAEWRVSRRGNRRAARPRPINETARAPVPDLEPVPTSNVAAPLFGMRGLANSSMVSVVPTLALGRTIGNQAMLPLIARSIAPGEFAKKLGNEDEFAKSSVLRASARLILDPIGIPDQPAWALSRR